MHKKRTKSCPRLSSKKPAPTVLLVNLKILLKLRMTCVKLDKIKTPVKMSEIPRLHVGTSMSAKSLGNLLIASARKNEIQSPLVLPLPSTGISPDSCSAVRGAKKSDGRHWRAQVMGWFFSFFLVFFFFPRG